MIVNHRYRFIFVKTRKTAGTSIEIALSQFCDDGDIITPISDRDEAIRRELGFRGPQNYDVPLRHLGIGDWARLLTRGRRRQFYHHAGAAFIRRRLGDDIWNSYYKFCFERDPFDKAISRYYWSTSEPRPPIADYLESAPERWLSNWEIYTIDDRIAVDHVARYENLDAELAAVAARLGLPGELALPRAKGGFRKNRDHYSRTLDERARRRIEQVCRREMAALGYAWQVPDEASEAG